MEKITLDEKLNDAACKAEEIAAIVQCVTAKVEQYDIDFKLFISGALYGAISLCEYLQHDLNDLAQQAISLRQMQK